MTKDDKAEVNYLVKQLAQGNVDAFDRLYTIMYEVIFSFLRKYYKDDEVIKDVITQTFMVVIQKSKNRMYFTNCYSWILTIAKFNLYNAIRKEDKTKTSIALADDIVDKHWNEKVYDNVSLGIAVDNLPLAERNLLYLKFHEEATYKEIADAVNISESTVKRRLKSILENLRETLREEDCS